MALKLEQKQQIVAEVNEVASSALSAVVADYRGLTVAEMTDHARQSAGKWCNLRVVRNTLAKRALEGTDYECLNETFVGPTLVAFSQEDPGSAARLLKDYAKELEALEVKAVAIGGEMYGADQIDRVAKLADLGRSPRHAALGHARPRSPNWPVP